MSRRISEALRTAVARRAEYRCEYCRLPELATGRIAFEVDHVVAVKHGGKTVLSNLAYTCARCNRNKGSDLTTVLADEISPVRFFHPRRDVWTEHFEVQEGIVHARTSIGEATVKLFQINTLERVAARQLLMQEGLYP